MKRWMAVLAVVLAAAPLCGAQATEDAAKRAQVDKLIVAMHMDRMVGQMMDVMKEQVKRSTEQASGAESMTPQQKKIFDAYMDKTMDLVTELLSPKTLQPEMEKLYMNTFSVDEINAMVGLYASPVGQSILEKMPQVMSGSVQMMQGKMGDLQPRIKALQEQFIKDMAAAAPQGKKTSPPSY